MNSFAAKPHIADGNAADGNVLMGRIAPGGGGG